MWCCCSSKLYNSINSIIVVPLQSEVEEIIKRIESHKGVIGTLVVNAEGESTDIKKKAMT